MRPVAALALLSLTRSPAQAGELLRADVRADGSSLLRVEARNAGGAQEGSRAAALLEADLGSNASAPPEGVIYLYDETKRFTNEGWSSPNMMDTTDGKVHGPLGGHFTLVKTFKNLPPHSRVRVEVRYYALNNWALGGQGSVHIDGKIVWKGAAPKGCGEMEIWRGKFPHTYQRCYKDVVYESKHSESVITVGAGGALDQEWHDEFAAIGRVKIAVEQLCEEGVCRAGWQLKTPTPSTWARPSSKECCEATCQDSFCPMSEGKRPRWDHPTLCPSNLCTVEFCCLQRGVCSPCVCTGNKTLKARRPTGYCRGKECTEAECCQGSPKCRASLCRRSGMILKNASVPSECKGERCTVEECCAAPSNKTAAAEEEDANTTTSPAPAPRPKNFAARGAAVEGRLLAALVALAGLSGRWA